MNKNNRLNSIIILLVSCLLIVSPAIASSWIAIIGLSSVVEQPRLGLSAASSKQKNLILSVVSPHSLSLSGEQFNWKIQPLTGNLSTVYLLQGMKQRVSLPTGYYEVILTVGSYQASKRINIQSNQQQQEIFIADIGRITATANETVMWSIQPLSGGRPLQLSEQGSFLEGSSINVIVPSGLYKVDAALKGLHRAERVRVKQGKLVVSNLFIPAGKVNLIATRGNAPLFKPTTWNIFRIENGERTQLKGEYNRHIQAVTIPPGHYEAIARSEDIVRTREFWVNSGATNDVQVSMD